MFFRIPGVRKGLIRPLCMHLVRVHDGENTNDLSQSPDIFNSDDPEQRLKVVGQNGVNKETGWMVMFNKRALGQYIMKGTTHESLCTFYTLGHSGIIALISERPDQMENAFTQSVHTILGLTPTLGSKTFSVEWNWIGEGNIEYTIKFLSLNLNY